MSADAREDGVTLIELMVVLLLVGIISGIVSGGIITAMRATRQDQKRATSVEAVQDQLDRIGRDLRVADPLRVAAANDVVADIYRNGTCLREEWAVAGTDLTRRVLTYASPAACSVYPASSAASKDSGVITIMRGLANGAVPAFTYFDHAGTALAGPAASSVAGVHIYVSQSQPEKRASVIGETTVNLRNGS